MRILAHFKIINIVVFVIFLKTRVVLLRNKVIGNLIKEKVYGSSVGDVGK